MRQIATMFRAVPLLLLVCVFMSVTLWAGDSFWAQTTYVRGDVTMVPAGSTEAGSLKLGDILHRGDSVSAAKGSKASFLLHDGSILVLKSGHEITMGKEEKSGSPTLAGVAKNLAGSLLAREGDNPMLKHLGGLRAGEKNIALAPTQTRVERDDLTFVWLKSPLTKKYIFTLMGPDNLFYETGVTDTRFTIDSKTLSPDATYYWEVRDASMADSFSALGSGSFTTLDSETQDKINQLRDSIRGAYGCGEAADDLTPFFLEYQIYREHELNLAALKTLAMMMEKDQTNEELLRWRKDLTRAMGLEERDLETVLAP